MGEHLKSIAFYLLVYGVMTLGAFGVIALIREDGKPLETMDDYTGLAKEHPGIALCMAIFMLSLAGMPPMGGFFAKFMVFRGAIEQGAIQSAQHHSNAIIIGAVIGILTSVASLYYYLRVLVAMYMSPETHGHGEEDGPGVKCRYAWNSNILIAAAGLVTLAIGIIPNWFF
jgi:NADH-quinone oxidoreductase subunit N